MKNNRILFVAPSSYPIYGAEANCNSKVLKVLSNAGYKVDLVCRALRHNIKFYPPSKTDLFFGDVASITSVEVDTKKDLSTFIRHINTYLKTGHVYKGSDWSYKAIKTCEEMMKTNHYDYIFTYDYPSEIVGLYFAKKYGLKWVATWNDPYMWIKYPKPYGDGPNALISGARRKLIKEIGLNTYINIFPSERLKNYMLSYMSNMKDTSCVIIPHIMLNELQSANDKALSQTLSIIHAGALGRERNPKLLLEGLSLFLCKNPNAQVELNFLGIFERAKSDYFSNLIDSLNLSKYIKRIPPVPYAESLSIIRDYDICLLLEADCDEGIFLPSKISDYMQNNKPIWAISPKVGTIQDLYNDGFIDYISDVKDVNSICKQFELIYTDFINGKLGIANKDYSSFGNQSVLRIFEEKIFASL